MRGIATLVTLLALANTGCITLSERSIDHDFGGLRGAMARSHTVCMLLVHGMGGYSNGDPQTLISSVQSRLQLRATGPAWPTTVPPSGGKEAASLVRQDYLDPSGRVLRIYTLQWESLTASLKQEYLAYDDDSSVTRLRLPIHNSLKQDLMNGNVPDVVLYVGDYKIVLQKAVKSALRQMQSDLGNDPDYEFFFVTFSLGSKIVFDVVDEMDNEAERQNSNELVDRTASFFMLANQIPLLGLGSASPTSRPADPAAGRGYESMLRFVRRKSNRIGVPGEKTAQTEPAHSPLAIVAVSDPNDLFSYTIPPYIRQQSPGTFINAVLSVARTGYLIPNKGYVANPLDAHTGYGHDPDVIKMIIDGAKATNPPH